MEVPLKFLADVKLAQAEQNRFSDSYANDINESDDNFLRRSKIIKEIYCTEVSYLLQLEILIKFFMIPIHKKMLIPTHQFDLMFSNMTQLYKVNSELLEALAAEPKNVSNAFTVFAPFFKLYSIYAYGYKKSMEILESADKKNKPLHSFIKRQETRPEVGITLISLLISPIQRIPRYRLLLQSLLESTPSDHPMYSATLDALSKVEETAAHINKLITEAEEREVLIELARRIGSRGNSLVIPGRKILKQGILMKTLKNGTGSQARYVVLMSDALLCCKGSEKGPLTFSRLIPLRHLKVEPVLGSALFKITFGEDSLLLYTADPEDGADWIQSLNSAVGQHITCRRTLRKDSSKIPVRKRSRMGRATAAIKNVRGVCKRNVRQACFSKLKQLRSKNR